MEVTATATGIDVVDPEELKRRTRLSAYAASYTRPFKPLPFAIVACRVLFQNKATAGVLEGDVDGLRSFCRVEDFGDTNAQPSLS